MTTAPPSLKTLREEAAHCRARHWWKDATQTVFGEGPQTAQMMLVGRAARRQGRPRRLIDLDDGIKALVTVHPSYLLRLPDADAKAKEYARFVDDLKIAAALLRKSARAA
jgi:uracil-DNA glycosylase